MQRRNLGVYLILATLLIGSLFYFVPKIVQAANVSVDNKAGATGGAVMTPASCSTVWDPDDPKKPPDIAGRYRDEIAAPDQTEASEGFVAYCSQVASQTPDPERRMEIEYQVARIEDVLDRHEAYRTRLQKIATAYPAAAYALAVDLTKDLETDADTEDLERIWSLYAYAFTSGHRLAEAQMKKLAPRLFPVAGYNFPGLATYIYTGHFEKVPDTVDTRVAVLSLWDGFRQRCESWEIIKISPEDEAALKNYLLPVTVSKVIGGVQQIPDIAKKFGDWTHGIGNRSILSTIQDVNSGMALPNQLVWTTNPAATADGSRYYDKNHCSGLQATRMAQNLLAYIRSQTATDLTEGAPELARLAVAPNIPDLLTPGRAPATQSN